MDGQDTGEMFCLITDLLDHVAYPAAQLAAAYAWRWTRVGDLPERSQICHHRCRALHRPDLPLAAPELIAAEHAAWICGTELIRALARTAARQAAPARKGRRAGQPVQPREISFTAARRAALASIRSGAATASLPAPMAGTFHRDTLRVLGKRRIVIDRDRHRDRKTKTRQAFPAPDVTSPRVPRSPRSASTDRQRPDRPPPRALSPFSDPCPNRRMRNRPPARSDSRATSLPITLRNQNPRPSRCPKNAVTNADHAEVHGIGS